MNTHHTQKPLKRTQKGKETVQEISQLVISNFPPHLTKEDVKFVLSRFAEIIDVQITKIASESHKMTQFDKKCVITVKDQETQDLLAQKRYFLSKTVSGKPVYLELIIPVLKTSKGRKPLNLLDFEKNRGLVKRTLFVTGIEKSVTRGDFIDFLLMNSQKIASVSENTEENIDSQDEEQNVVETEKSPIELLVFKVTKEGESTGDARVVISKSFDPQALRDNLPQDLNGNTLKYDIFSTADKYFEQKLSKEVEMERRKIQRKVKKLFKFPASETREAFKTMFDSSINEESKREDQSNLRLNYKFKSHIPLETPKKAQRPLKGCLASQNSSYFHLEDS